MQKVLSLQLALGKPLKLSEVAEMTGLDDSVVRKEIEHAIREHYFHFASKPINIEFDPNSGYVITATSAIGMLKTPNFVINLIPKIPKLSVGKCLGLAQESGIKQLNINQNNLIDSAFSEKSSNSTVDFLGFSLANAIIRVVNNGMARRFEEVYGTATKLSGNIQFQATIASGKSLLGPIIEEISPSLDIYPNRVLKFALSLCLRESHNDPLKHLVSSLLQSFDEVQDIDDSEIDTNHLFADYSLPRPDYELALAFAKALIEGMTVELENKGTFVPSFTLDLDRVFEQYCSKTVRQLMNEERYEVLNQREFRHEIAPYKAEKSIIPDIVVRDKESGECVVLDVKNKYSQLRNDGDVALSNQDLYQLTYYAQSLNALCCLLIYPSMKPPIQYPIKSSESETTYQEKKRTKRDEIESLNKIAIFREKPIRLYTYNIDLSGTMENTKRSVAGLSQLVADIIHDR